MANVAEAEAPLLGLTLAGKYTLEEVVGIGAMGAVYRAAHLSLDKPVAVKVLHPSLAQHPSFVERFKREAFSASRLDHPNSLRVLDFGEDVERGLVYLVLDYIEGEDLLAVMQREWPFDDERIVNIISQTLAALSVAHDLGIVHRDLKPENILLLPATDDEGRAIDAVKVCDFGIAKLAMRAVEEGRPFASHLTTEGLIIGTPDYMSPEQARGIDVDGRSDIYSMGCVLYHLLAGRTPFISESPLGIAIQHVSDAPEPPSRFRATHAGLEAVCLKALAKRPDDRFQTAREMRRALRLALGQAASMLPSIVPAPAVAAAASKPTGAGNGPGVAVVGSASSASTPMPTPTVDGESDATLAGPRFSSSTAPTELATVPPPSPATSRRWQRGAALAAVALGIGATMIVMGSRSSGPSAAMLQMPAPAPTATSISPPTEPAPAPGDPSLGADRARPSVPTTSSNARLVPVRPTPVDHNRNRATASAASRRLEDRRADEGSSDVVPPPNSGKTPADNAKAALLPVASLPGTSTNTVAPDNALAAPSPTVSVERAAAPVAPPAVPTVYDVSAAAVSVGAISTTSGISVASVRSAVAHLALTSCYRQALRAQPNNTRMQATLTLSIDITGRVVGASLSRDGNLPNLRSCIETEARGTSVRDVDTGEGSATVTLTFAPQ